jgi:hypothetical protein
MFKRKDYILPSLFKFMPRSFQTTPEYELHLPYRRSLLSHRGNVDLALQCLQSAGLDYVIAFTFVRSLGVVESSHRLMTLDEARRREEEYPDIYGHFTLETLFQEKQAILDGKSVVNRRGFIVPSLS